MRGCSPAAFLDTIELVIKGIESTVAVISLIPYSTRSAGTSASVWPTIQQPTFPKMLHICLESRLTWKPGIDSNLSRVPPK